MPRPSPVSDAVRGLFEARGRHAWTIEELHQEAVASLGGADYSSVFRAVALLEKEGLIARVDVGDRSARFEVRDDHHEHVRCDVCGRVAEVAGCVVDDVAERIADSTGYRITSHKVVFGGVCPDCDRASAAKRD
jgi:Fe2+ or Zn2+ uptake regulation protein